jgi:phage virion morphogenesis protein
MASIKLTLTGDGKATKQLLEFGGRAKNLKPAFRDVGEYMLLSTRRNFDRSKAPDGTAWTPLKPATIKAKERRKAQGGKKKSRGKKLVKRTRANPTDILKDTYELRDTIAYRVSDNGVEIGSPLKYARAHQLGDREKNVPKRSFLGLSSGDRQEIVEIFREHLEG